MVSAEQKQKEVLHSNAKRVKVNESIVQQMTKSSIDTANESIRELLSKRKGLCGVVGIFNVTDLCFFVSIHIG